MRIALLGSVSSVIPPQGQAAIERLAYQQALGLAQRGHTILLFALSGSTVPHKNVRVIVVGEKTTLSGVGKEGSNNEEDIYGASYKLRLELVHLARVIGELTGRANEYDVIVNNMRGEAVLLPVAASLQKPFYHVMHLPIFPELATLFQKYQTHCISISNAQRKANPHLSYAGTAYNAVDTKEFSFSPTHKNYTLYLGSIGRNKNPKDGILAAKAAGATIRIGGRIKDEAYYKEEIEPLIDGKTVEWVGELHPKEVIALYQGAKAFLFPTLWEEPFGLVMIEAMACGTPVIAYPNGATPEIVRDGKNGFLVHTVDEMAEKIKIIDTIDRKTCRASVEEKFSIQSMIDAYENILLKEGATRK